VTRSPRYPYPFAIFLGLLAAFVPANLPLESPPFITALLISTAIFGVAGLLCGVLWPATAWRWGVWIVTLGLITSGQLARFLGDVLPFLALGLVGSCLGGEMGSRLRQRPDPGAP
jgi:hypothetical protein